MICEIGFPKCICIATVPLSMTIAFRIAGTSIMDVVHLNITECDYDRLVFSESRGSNHM